MQQEALQTVLACSQCGRALPPSDLVQISGQWVCGECKPAFLSRLMVGDSVASASLRYAGVGVRFGARFIDGLIFLVPIVIVLVLMMPSLLRTTGNNPLAFNGLFISIGLGFSLFYEVLMLRFRGATLGKMACGLRVVRPDGSGLGWGVSFGRYFMYNVVISSVPLVNWILLLTTAIMAGTDNESRGLHDRVCDTRVIHTR